MKNGGKLAILVIILVATVLGSFGWLWHAMHGQKLLDAWGSDSAMAIRHGTKVELLRLSNEQPADSPPDDEGSGKSISLPETTLWIEDVRNITGVHELKHYQRALADDYSYEWDAKEAGEDCRPQWSQALRFDYEGDRKTIVFDFSCRRAYNVEKDSQLHLEEKTAAALERFIARQYDDAPQADGSAVAN